MTFLVLAAGVMAFALLQSLVIPVLPTIQAALHTTQADVTWVLTAYLLSASISTPIVGRLGDMTGKKRMFVVALSALALGCLLAAVATSLPVMIVARVIQGVGGGVMPLAFGPPRHPCPLQRQVLDRVDERVVLEQLALLPEQATELRAVEGPETAEEDGSCGVAAVAIGSTAASRRRRTVESTPRAEPSSACACTAILRACSGETTRVLTR